MSDEPLSEDVEAAIALFCDTWPGREGLPAHLRAFAREMVDQHHKLVQWPDCPTCRRYYQQDYSGAIENARLESVLLASQESAKALAEALEKIDQSGGGPGPRQFRINTLAIVRAALATCRSSKGTR